MRPAPRIEVADIVARAILQPNGRHFLEVAVPSGIVGIKFTADQVQQLKTAIENYEAETIRADGGPDFHNPKSVPIEVRR